MASQLRSQELKSSDVKSKPAPLLVLAEGPFGSTVNTDIVNQTWKTALDRQPADLPVPGSMASPNCLPGACFGPVNQTKAYCVLKLTFCHEILFPPEL